MLELGILNIEPKHESTAKDCADYFSFVTRQREKKMEQRKFANILIKQLCFKSKEGQNKLPIKYFQNTTDLMHADAKLTTSSHGNIEITRNTEAIGQRLQLSINRKPTKTGISVSYKGPKVAVAINEKGKIGIDMELIEPRSVVFTKGLFSENENACLPSYVAASTLSFDEICAVFWSMKEAFFKGGWIKANIWEMRHLNIIPHRDFLVEQTQSFGTGKEYVGRATFNYNHYCTIKEYKVFVWENYVVSIVY